MGSKEKQRFYIGGRWYSPDNATPLCRYGGIFDTVTLYQSPHGAFFTVAESLADLPAVKVLTEREARAFMDEHAAGIDTENYNRIFGEPEQG